MRSGSRGPFAPFSRPGERGGAASWVVRLATLCAAALLVVPFAEATERPMAAPSPGPHTAKVPPLNGPYAHHPVNYTATTDGWPLSYEEWLPLGFQPAQSYSLAVYLHGMQGAGPWQPGGVKSEIIAIVDNDTTYEGTALRAMMVTATNNSFILITPNTRTGAGFYVNSECGGAQQQDLLDAIVHEKLVHHILRTYLIGFSMGSIGALSLSASHPKMFAGVAVAGTMTDGFSALAYRAANQHSTSQSWANASYHTMLAFTCGNAPGGGNATVDSIYQYLSLARLKPFALNLTPLYVVSGGLDNRAPNSASFDAYFQVNNTFVNSTCRTYPGEPGNCTTPLAALHESNMSQYRFRNIYEPQAGHTYGQFNATDLFAWFGGRVPTGFYISHFYPPTAIAPTVPANLPSGPVPLSLVATVQRIAGVLNTTFAFNATAAGGVGAPFTFLWSFGDTSHSSGTAVTHLFPAPGSFNVTVVASDSQGNTTNASLPTIEVTPPMDGSIGLSVVAPWTGLPVSLVAQVIGGAGPYGCAWSFGDGASATGCSAWHSWTDAGNFAIGVTATDANGDSISRSLTVPVSATPPSTGGGSSSSSAGSGVITFLTSHLPLVGGALAVLLALAIVAIVLSRRRRIATSPTAARAPAGEMPPGSPPPPP